MIYIIDLKQQLKLPEDSMFSGFTPIIGYELKPIFIKTTSDRVSIIFIVAGCSVVSIKPPSVINNNYKYGNLLVTAFFFFQE